MGGAPDPEFHSLHGSREGYIAYTVQDFVEERKGIKRSLFRKTKSGARRKTLRERSRISIPNHLDL